MPVTVFRASVLAAALLAGRPAAAAAPDLVANATFAAEVRDDTTAGRKLLRGALPPYPLEEHGRWTQSCIALRYTVRADGRADKFVLLEHSSPRNFVRGALEALVNWEYAPARAATEESAVFRFERSAIGGRLMRLSARRFDSRSADSRGCGTLEPSRLPSETARIRGR